MINDISLFPFLVPVPETNEQMKSDQGLEHLLILSKKVWLFASGIQLQKVLYILHTYMYIYINTPVIKIKTSTLNIRV